MGICKNCKNKFEGNYCNSCGEKVVHDADFSLKKLMSQAFDSITHLDSKLFKTLKLLFFYPGKLSMQFVDGIRIPYMKPFQIFIISNIMFFFIFSNEDLFKYPSSYFFIENFEGIRVMNKVRQIVQNSDFTESEVAKLYDVKSTNLAKGLLIFLIPLIALISKLFNPKQKLEFGKHIIFSTHFLTFVLLLFGIVGIMTLVIPENFEKKLIIIPLGILIYFYYSTALKNFYHNSNTLSFIKGIFGILSIFILVELYKIFVSALTLYTL